MSKTVKIWVAKPLNGGKEVMKKTLRGLCEDLKLSYSTAKSRQDKTGGATVWIIGKYAYEISRTEIDG